MTCSVGTEKGSFFEASSRFSEDDRHHDSTTTESLSIIQTLPQPYVPFEALPKSNYNPDVTTALYKIEQLGAQ
jgi:hypothetical protein